MTRAAVALLAVLLAVVLAPAARAQDGRAGAGAVVHRYYAAINRGDFRTAYAQWGGDGRASGKSLAGFTHGFAETRSSQVTLGTPGRLEAGAGSLYVRVPVEVFARLRNGQRQHFRGAYVLRRANGVPGASPASRRWHIDSARLRAVG